MAEVLAVRVTPHAARDRLLGFRRREGLPARHPAAAGRGVRSEAAQQVLVVQVTAPPEGGRANRALIALLARSAGIPRRDVELIAGARNRDKLVRVPAGTTASLRLLLPCPDVH